MITTETKKGASIKEIRKRDNEKKEQELRLKCEEFAVEKYTKEQLVNWSNKFKGIWFLPILGEEGNIEMLGIMQPITRSILSYASTKIQDEGLYEFLEAAMRECWIDGDTRILDEDDYFIPASQQFNKILEGKKAALVKR
jgi:hypothetical protein